MSPHLILIVTALALLLLVGCAQPAGQAPTPPTVPAVIASPTGSPGTPQSARTLAAAAPASAPTPTAPARPVTSPTVAAPLPSPTVAFSTPSPAGGQPGSPGAVPAEAQAVVEKAKLDAAAKAGVGVDQVTVVSVKAVEWPDSSLGCPQPGFMYAQVITPGYLVVLSAGGKTYEYHTNRTDQVVTCANPRPALGGGQ